MEKPRKLPNGRYQARIWADGKRMSLGTYDTLREAQSVQWKAQTRLEGGEDPTGGKIRFEKYSIELINSRSATLTPETVRNYLYILKKHLAPTFGSKSLKDITPVMVRRWYNSLPDAPIRRASYTLLRSILRQAVEDGEVLRNVANIRGAAKDTTKKRPAYSLADVSMLREMAGKESQMSTLLLFLAGTGTRIGEAVSMTWGDIDFQTGAVTVDKHETRVAGVVDGTKHHGKEGRVITAPQPVLDALQRLRATREASDPGSPVWLNTKGNRLTYTTFHRDFTSLKKSVGLDGLRAHDIRHTHLTEFAQHATMAELMARGGHTDHRSALRYQHPSLERDAEIAAKLAEKLQ